jgi:hypothetical protein
MQRETQFSLAAAFLILLNAVGLIVVTTWFPNIMPTLPGSSGNDPNLMYTLASLGLVFGFLVLLGSALLQLKPDNKKIWGATILAFSVPSLIMGGGFIIGFILGIIAGYSAISRKNKN